MGRPAVSIIIESVGVREASWNRLRSCLEAVARQDALEPVEVVLCEMGELRGEVAEDIKDIVPNLRIVAGAGTDPCARKTLAVQSSTAPIVAFVDADCMPQSGWLRSILETFQYYPEVSVVHGQMAGEKKSWLGRLLPTRCEAGRVRTSAANNVAFRREAYLDCPFPDGSGSNAVRLQTKALLRARYVLWAEPAMRLMRDRRGLKQAAGAQVEYSTVAR